MTARLAHPPACARSPIARAAAVTVLLVLVIAGCGSQTASVPAPDGPAQGSLLVIETRPCNWLWPPDPNRCDAVGLARIDLDGELLEELTPELPMAMRSMALSHERSAIAWTWNWELAVMGIDGSAPRVVNDKLLAENMGETLLDPTWSPDGSELLYRWSGATGKETWYRVSVESGELAEVPMPVDCAALAWSPDGRRVACEVWAGDEATGVGETDLFLVDLETLAATELTRADDGISAYRPDWSPDGRWLALARRTDDEEAASDADGIWILDVETGEGKRVAPGAISVPSWSPDGGHLAAYDDELGKVIIVGRDGSGLVVLDHEPRRFVAPRWLPDD